MHKLYKNSKIDNFLQKIKKNQEDKEKRFQNKFKHQDLNKKVTLLHKFQITKKNLKNKFKHYKILKQQIKLHKKNQLHLKNNSQQSKIN